MTTSELFKKLIKIFALGCIPLAIFTISSIISICILKNPNVILYIFLAITIPIVVVALVLGVKIFVSQMSILDKVKKNNPEEYSEAMNIMFGFYNWRLDYITDEKLSKIYGHDLMSIFKWGAIVAAFVFTEGIMIFIMKCIGIQSNNLF